VSDARSGKLIMMLRSSSGFQHTAIRLLWCCCGWLLGGRLAEFFCSQEKENSMNFSTLEPAEEKPRGDVCVCFGSRVVNASCGSERIKRIMWFILEAVPGSGGACFSF